MFVLLNLFKNDCSFKAVEGCLFVKSSELIQKESCPYLAIVGSDV